MIKRVEPLCWWIGMRTPLQLMIYGENLAGSSVEIKGKGIRIKEVHKADSPNFLFVDITVDKEATPGEYIFDVRKGKEVHSFSYYFYERRKDSAIRESFSPADLVYLVMPDRFANGDSSNDSTPDTIEKANRKEPFGRHGGDLQGIIDHLDYMANLGVTTLWLTPPQLDNEPNESYHGYACADYYHIDPRYGDNDLYRKLVTEAHRKGMKVIMDAVPNHCGLSHWWLKDLPFKDWLHMPPEFIRSNYRLATLSDPNSSEYNRRHTFEGWFDDSMPDMAIEQPYVLQYFLQLYIWWVEFANLDGLRVDTFPYNEKHAIARWTQKTLEEYPNLNIVAECWHSSPANVAYWLGIAPNSDGYISHLPSVMDFPLQEALVKSLSIDSTGWMEGMNVLYEALAQDFLYSNPQNLLIFLDNHDIDRFADSVGGETYKIKLGLTLLATLRGIPQLYYGTEYGFITTDPAQGHGAARRDFPGGWKGDRKNLFTGKGKNKKETEIFEHACKLFNWRKNAIAIHKGRTTHFLPENNTYAYFRYTPEECVFVFINPSAHDTTIKWSQYRECLGNYTKGKDILTGREITIGKKFTVPARQSAVVELYT